MEDPDPGMASSSSCYCREAVNALVHKLTELMEHRPVIRDLLRGLATDELFQVWKMVLEMAYGIHDWTDGNLATSTNLVESEEERRQIREIQARIRDARRRCRSRSYDAGADHQDGAAVGAEGLEDRAEDGAGGAMKNSSVVAASDDVVETVSIRFGDLPIFVMKRFVVDGENEFGVGLFSSSKLVFLGANLLLRKEEEMMMRVTRPKKKFIQIGSMQVELPT